MADGKYGMKFRVLIGAATSIADLATDIDAPGMATALGVVAFPTLLFVSGGEVVRREEGPRDANEIIQMALETWGSDPL